MEHVQICEVGLRDGLQNISAIVPTEIKKQWIHRQFEAGTREIEVGSFVPAKLLPQLADTAELVKYAKTIRGLTVVVLAPNLRGVTDATKAGVDKIVIPFSMSESHSIRNVRKNHEQMVAEIKACVDYLRDVPEAKRPWLEVSLSVAFGCTIEGKVSESTVVHFAEKMMEIEVDELCLSDSTGVGSPWQLQSLVEKIWATCGSEKLQGVHLHNTRGLGLANALKAVELGITTLDSSLGGLGGCPWAPGASGNIVTEDLVYLLESMGINTGIDLSQLFEVRKFVDSAIADEPLYGFASASGIPPGWPYVAAG